MSFFNLENPKKKPKKFKGIMLDLQLSKKYVFGTKKLKKRQKLQFIWTYENMVKF